MHSVRLAATSAGGAVSWQPLNRVVFGWFAGRKVTLDGGSMTIRGTEVTSRLVAAAGAWAVLTVAFDGHLPLGAATLAWARCGMGG